MAAIFGEGKFFLKIVKITFLKYPVFCQFWQKFKMAAIFGEGKIFGKLQRVHSLDTLRVENFAEIALSRTVKEIEAN